MNQGKGTKKKRGHRYHRTAQFRMKRRLYKAKVRARKLLEAQTPPA